MNLEILLAGAGHQVPVFLLASVLAGCGVTALLARRDVVGIIMGVELLLNSGVLHVLAARAHRAKDAAAMADGSLLVLAVLLLAAAEAAVALALCYRLYRANDGVALGAARRLRGDRP